MEKKTYIEVSLKDGGIYICPPDNYGSIMDEIESMVENGYPDQVLTIKTIWMTDEKYNNLPEFQEH